MARIEVVDASGVGLGARVVAALRERFPLSRAPYLTVVNPAEVGVAQDRALLRVRRDEVLGYLLLTPATLTGDSARYEGRNAASFPDVDAIRGAVRSQVLAYRMEQEGIDADKVAAFARFRLTMHVQRVDDEGRESRNRRRRG